MLCALNPTSPTEPRVPGEDAVSTVDGQTHTEFSWMTRLLLETTIPWRQGLSQGHY